MHWTDQINRRDSAFLGAPDLLDGQSRVAEAMGGLADDDCMPPSPAAIASFAADLDDHDRVHEAMGGICRADEL
jgi:hypothetical protein